MRKAFVLGLMLLGAAPAAHAGPAEDRLTAIAPARVA